MIKRFPIYVGALLHIFFSYVLIKDRGSISTFWWTFGLWQFTYLVNLGWTKLVRITQERNDQYSKITDDLLDKLSRKSQDEMAIKILRDENLTIRDVNNNLNEANFELRQKLFNE